MEDRRLLYPNHATADVRSHEAGRRGHMHEAKNIEAKRNTRPVSRYEEQERSMLEVHLRGAGADQYQRSNDALSTTRCRQRAVDNAVKPAAFRERDLELS